jgi:hypothetical protein
MNDQKAIIHFARVGKKEALYIEGFVSDDGIRLDTSTQLPPDAAKVWNKSVWQKKGILSHGEIVRTIRKHHFYQEWFDIIEVIDDHGTLLGYYCDIATPLIKRDEEYYVQDLLLDVWIFPDGSFHELDWDEYTAAKNDGAISVEWQQNAERTIRWMAEEIVKGTFPQAFLPSSG